MLENLNSAINFHKNKDFNKAKKIYENILDKFPSHYQTLNLLGTLLLQIKDYKKSISYLYKAAEINSKSHILYNNLGAAFMNLKDYENAINNFKKAINLNPNYAGAYNNFATCLKKKNLFEDAYKNYKYAIQLNRNYSEAYFNLGILLTDRDLYEDAIINFNEAIGCNKNYIEAYEIRAHSYNILKRYNLAVEDYSKLIIINPKKKLLYQTQILLNNIFLCNWNNYQNISLYLENKKSELVPPLNILYLLDEPKTIKNYVDDYNNRYFKNKIFKKKLYGLKKKITIGYFSADFRNHAVSFLISGVLKNHNKDNFKIIGFNLSKKSDDIITNEIKTYFNEFINVSKLSDEEIIKLSHKYKIDIAIDLMGHTLNNRLNIFFQKVAPIQVNFLGYPGTIGNCMDYIIADEYLITNVDQKFYFEKIIYMPGSYQPFNENNLVKKKINNLIEFRNTKKTFVYCNFNNTNKLNPIIFDSWMKILIKTKNTVLCLLENNNISKINLLKEAKKKGVNSDRIIFSPCYDYDIHINRYKFCNLFLDTFPYSSHTIAREALTNNLPLLSIKGKSFQSRVSPSLLNNLGLTELIANNIADYEKTAVTMANNVEFYNKTKNKLITSLKNSEFNNSKIFCRNLELAYKKIYKIYINNLKPSNIYLKDDNKKNDNINYE